MFSLSSETRDKKGIDKWEMKAKIMSLYLTFFFQVKYVFGPLTFSENCN